MATAPQSLTGTSTVDAPAAPPSVGASHPDAPPAAPPAGRDAAVPTALTIAAAARETGLTPDTLRYYEREGLMLQPVDRVSSSHRRYGDDDLYWIRLLTKLRGTGMPIRAVREYAALVRAGTGNEAERLALLEDHRTAVLAQLEATRQNLEAIDHKIAVYRERAAEPAAGRTVTP
ncbi:MerR family transcriptional regulator [Patulibacter americanus]|uniref:MerR family transcriptional regulator n=1 Tax=Patulibacter americanus TaxID=588672 RepID=UPI0003B46CE5|nr:MerR family transcriptional regulator [Patulibacter americanus]